MSPELFEQLKSIDTQWKYEITIDAKGVKAKVGKENYSISKYVSNMDEAAIWILNETKDIEREA